MKNISPISRTNWLRCSSVINCASELNALVKVEDTKTKRKLIKSFNDCVINAISEISLNCLNGKIPLSKREFQNLSKYRSVLRLLSNKSIKIQRKRSILNQKGGFLQFLIPPALGLISTVVANYLNKKIQNE